MTGTPIQNAMLDLYGLLKFLDLDPLCEKPLFKYLFTATLDNPIPEEQRRTKCWNLFLSEFLLLRRTKTDKIKGTNKPIVQLPEKKIELIKFELGEKERYIYDKIFEESREKVRTLLKNQRVEVTYRFKYFLISIYCNQFLY